jgi:hypothetical protein
LTSRPRPATIGNYIRRRPDGSPPMPRHDEFDPFALPPLRPEERRQRFWLGLAVAAGYVLLLVAWLVYAVAGKGRRLPAGFSVAFTRAAGYPHRSCG